VSNQPPFDVEMDEQEHDSQSLQHSSAELQKDKNDGEVPKPDSIICSASSPGCVIAVHVKPDRKAIQENQRFHQAGLKHVIGT